MALVDRATRMITAPANEWQVVAGEATQPPALYSSYIVPLALITPVCSFVSTVAFGHRSFFVGGVIAIVTFLLELVNVAIVSVIAEALAPSFNAVKDRAAAFRWIAYSYTPRWIAGFALLVPVAGALIALLGSLYSLYVLFLGAVPVMRVPPDKSLGYTIVLVVATIVLFIIIGSVIGLLFAMLVAGAIISTGGALH